MSYESRQIDGDVSIGRNTAIGGDAIIQGKTHLKGNVRVDGWFEAKNTGFCMKKQLSGENDLFVVSFLYLCFA